MQPIVPLSNPQAHPVSARTRRVLVLGATGSIGRSTLDVLSRNREQFQIWGLTAQQRAAELQALVAEHHPRYVALGATAGEFSCPAPTEVLRGAQALEELAAHPDVDIVVVGVVGVAALPAVVAAARAGKQIALANKESVVCGGRLLADIVARHGAHVLPVDSEHSALFQVLADDRLADVESMTLTASGGPFLSRPRDTLGQVTPDEAARHPRWNMGTKVSIDSATLMNKALELMEAHFLFAVPEERLSVVIHPQSIVHSLVSFRDGSTLAQMGNPDMRTPIAYALAFPGQRIQAGVPALHLAALGTLSFQAVDSARFPAIDLARRALRAGGLAPAVVTVADEVAVTAFEAGKLPFDRIEHVVHRSLDLLVGSDYTSLPDLLGHLERVRARCQEIVVEEVRAL